MKTILAILAFTLICSTAYTQKKPLKVKKWVLVKGGTFQMGTDKVYKIDEELHTDEKPAHSVTLKSFKISQYEITNAQFCAFLNAVENKREGEGEDCAKDGGTKWLAVGGSHIERNSLGIFVPKPGKARHPVLKVSWYGARAYCKWAGGRLPTEAEWEYAFRGGNRSKGYAYSGSNNIDEVAWYSTNVFGPNGRPTAGYTRMVGSKKPNELGIYDMSGNIWEWCSDWYDHDYYKNGPGNNPQGPKKGTEKVVRGGCYSTGFDNFMGMAPDRMKAKPEKRSVNIGFRIVKEVN